MSKLSDREPETTPVESCDPVALVVTPKPSDIGAFEVRRALPSSKCRSLGPFVFLDQMGPAVLTPDNLLDVRPHPHIGLATVTWMIDGEIMHRDSLGSAQVIRPGELNWMTAGAGIVHSERTPAHLRDKRSSLFGVQCWVALPADSQEMPPEFAHYSAEDIPVYETEGAHAIVAVGTAWDVSSPVRTVSQTLLLQIGLEAGASITLPNDCRERGIYLLTGRVAIAGETFAPEQLLVLNEGEAVSVTAVEPACFMMLGGEPLDGPRHMYWNFVHTDKDRIEKAKEDWTQRRFPDVPCDEAEWIPLPGT